MTTSIFLLLCVAGEGFLVYCLVHFISESKVAMARPGGARPGARADASCVARKLCS